MKSTLTRPWGPYAAGTVVTDNAAEETAGAIHVNPDRFAKLHESGFFAPKEPARPVPAEVRTAVAHGDRIPKAPNAITEAREILERHPDLAADDSALAAALKKET